MKNSTFKNSAPIIITVVLGLIASGCGNRSNGAGVDVAKNVPQQNSKSANQDGTTAESDQQDQSNDNKTHNKGVKASSHGSAVKHTTPNSRRDQNSSTDVTVPHSRLPAAPEAPKSPNGISDVPDQSVVVTQPPATGDAPQHQKKNIFKKVFGPVGKIIPHGHKKSEVPSAPTQAPASDANKVVSFGSESITPDYLTTQPVSVILKQGKSCENTGKLTDGSRCYVVFGDGHSEWLNIGNRSLLSDLVKEIKPEQASNQDEVKDSDASK